MLNSFHNASLCHEQTVVFSLRNLWHQEMCVHHVNHLFWRSIALIFLSKVIITASSMYLWCCSIYSHTWAKWSIETPFFWRVHWSHMLLSTNQKHQLLKCNTNFIILAIYLIFLSCSNEGNLGRALIIFVGISFFAHTEGLSEAK